MGMTPNEPQSRNARGRRSLNDCTDRHRPWQHRRRPRGRAADQNGGLERRRRRRGRTGHRDDGCPSRAARLSRALCCCVCPRPNEAVVALRRRRHAHDEPACAGRSAPRPQVAERLRAGRLEGLGRCRCIDATGSGEAASVRSRPDAKGTTRSKCLRRPDVGFQDRDVRARVRSTPHATPHSA